MSKSKTPIDALLDTLEFTAVECNGMLSLDMDAVTVTHQAILTVLDKKLRVYKLSTGERVIDADDLENFFDNPFE